VPLTGSGSSARVHLTGSLLFPGLLPGESLRRRIKLPERGTLLAGDGTPLAEGPDRFSPIPEVAEQIVGSLGPIPSDQARAYAAQGYPANAEVGLDGLERIFQSRLEGRPGGELLAGHRVLARSTPAQAPPVKTTISPSLELAAVSAMGGAYAGMTVMNPRTGALLALAGIAFSNVQPPGSTMKMITVTGALQAGITKLSTTYPIETSTTVDGYTLQNASGEACGGTLLNAFAVSCNSVFVPLGVALGATRLVDTAERYGFNQPSSILGAAESTIPSPATIGDALAVGSSAIGQGLVQTTPLEMTDVAATIAMGGRRPIPTLLAGQKPRFVRVTSARVAHEVQQMMEAVVQFGTGTAAQIPGVQVAGKTGTAELRDTATNSGNPNASSPQNTDAWFVGYAPAGHPRFVVGALFPNQGAGGAAAAPPVRDVLVTALQQHG
jgi:cell division protein FtsI/penicillin-binding protein 2